MLEPFDFGAEEAVDVDKSELDRVHTAPRSPDFDLLRVDGTYPFTPTYKGFVGLWQPKMPPLVS